MSKTQSTQLLLCAFILLQLMAITGCHRSYYRRQADAEAQRLILQKTNDPRWDSATGTIDVDPQSRMFNPFSQDHPPIPPDDPTSHEFMHRVDGKDGYPHWHANGDTEYVQNPVWMSYLPQNEKGEVVLDLSSAYQLALIHSPTLQQQRETLYLSALDVSLERFGFDSQLFSGFSSFLETRGRIRNGGSSSTTLTNSLGANGGGLTARRLGITGTNFAVGLANTIVWNFAGANTQSANSLIDFSIIQPLLRGAGRERILESLTQSERVLLANVRQLERFRRGFYLQVATGRTPGQGVSTGSAAFLGTPSSGSANAGGYFGLLLQQQQIRNQEFNVRQQEALLEQFRELEKQDRINKLQVSQFESSVYQQQQSLLSARVSYQDSLDTFKQQLGLPPDLNIKIEDASLDQFNLISDQISKRIIEVGKLRVEAGFAVDKMVDRMPRRSELPYNEDNRLDPNGAIKFQPELKSAVEGLLPALKKAKSTIAAIRQKDRKLIVEDINAMDGVLKSRKEYLANLRQAIASGKVQSEVESKLFEPSTIPTKERLLETLEGAENRRAAMKNLKTAETGIDEIIAKIGDFDQLKSSKSSVEFYQLLDAEIKKKFPGFLAEIDGVVLELSLLQAAARSNTIEIKQVDIEDTEALATAKCLRRDWMNARAALVDSWRQIEFVADQLEAQVDIVFEGDIGSNSDNPFKIRSDNGRLRAGLRFDAPVVRLQERNNYRRALITYQQSRRRFYQFEDEINRELRQTIRNINQNKILFELNRQSIQVNIDAVQLSRARLEQPPRPGQAGGFGDTTAQDLTRAINSLTNVQNQYLRAWVGYEVLRRNLDFDLGTMDLDSRGEWVDPGSVDSSIGLRAAQRMGIELDCRFCDEMGVSSSPVNFSYETSTELGSVEGEAVYQSQPAYESATPMDPIEPSSLESEPVRELDVEPAIEAPVPEVPAFEPPGPELDLGPSLGGQKEEPREYRSGKIMLIGSATPANAERQVKAAKSVRPPVIMVDAPVESKKFLNPFSATKTFPGASKALDQNVVLTAASIKGQLPREDIANRIPSVDSTSGESKPQVVQSEQTDQQQTVAETEPENNPVSQASGSRMNKIPKVKGAAMLLIPYEGSNSTESVQSDAK